MKKIFASSFICALMLFAFAFISSAVTVVPGDFDLNGSVTASDARAILRIAAKLDKETNALKCVAADINSDGKINASDARKTLRLAAKLDNADYEVHDVELEKGTPADCTHDGLTDKAVCKTCGKVLFDHQTIKASHKPTVTIIGAENTCYSVGYTDQIECSVCGLIIQKSEAIPQRDHALSDDGVHCRWCSKVIRVFDDFKTVMTGRYKASGTSIDADGTSKVTVYYNLANSRTRIIFGNNDFTYLCRNLDTDPRVYVASEPKKIYAELDYDTACYLGMESLFYLGTVSLDPYEQDISVLNENYHGKQCTAYRLSDGQYSTLYYFYNEKLVGIVNYEYGNQLSDFMIDEFTGSFSDDIWYLKGYKCLDIETFFSKFG